MYEFQDLTPISGHFRTNFKIAGISGQRPGLYTLQLSLTLLTASHVYSGRLHAICVDERLQSMKTNCCEERRKQYDIEKTLHNTSFNSV